MGPVHAKLDTQDSCVTGVCISVLKNTYDDVNNIQFGNNLNLGGSIGKCFIFAGTSQGYLKFIQILQITLSAYTYCPVIGNCRSF